MLRWFLLFMLGVLTGALSVMKGCFPAKQDDCGFVQNVYGQRISWKGKLPILLQIHPSVPREFHDAIRAAAQKWEKSLGKPIFNIQVGSATLNPVAMRDGKNVIYYMPTWDTKKESEQGRTSVHWVGDEVMEADIRINARDFVYYWNGFGDEKSGKSVNIEALLIHEMGHVLGLRHRDENGSVMETYLAAQTNRVNLSSMDLTDLRCEY